MLSGIIGHTHASGPIARSSGSCVRLLGVPDTVIPPHIPTHTLGRTPSPTPGPIRARYPGKSVTLPRHPFPTPAPHTLPTRPTSSPRLSHFSPPIRSAPAISPPLLKKPYIRAILAHVGDRPLGPETLPPTGKDPRGIPCGCPASLVGALWRRRHCRSPPPYTVLFCHAVGQICLELPWPPLQNCTEPPALPATNSTEWRRI